MSIARIPSYWPALPWPWPWRRPCLQVTSAILRLLLALKSQQEHHRAHGSDISGGSGNESGACRWGAALLLACPCLARTCSSAHTGTSVCLPASSSWLPARPPPPRSCCIHVAFYRPALPADSEAESEEEGEPDELDSDEDEVDEAYMK